MDTQQQVEMFLSKASAIIFNSDGTDIVMNFFYDRNGFKHYKDKKNHQTLHDFIQDRPIRLVITETKNEYQVSLVDTDNADILNLKQVKFETKSFSWFINSVPIDKKFDMILSGVNDDATILVLPPIQKAVKIDGYSFYPLKK